MKKSLFKIVSLMLALGVLLSLSAISVSADDTTKSGSIDGLTNGTYSFNSTTGVLDISGTGVLSNGEWQSAIDIKAVKQINLHNGITEVPMYFTSNLNNTKWTNSTSDPLSNLATVTLPNTLTKIGQGAFINANIYKIMTYTDNETSTVEGFPSKLTEIGGQGFQSAALGNMTNGCLVIPASVTKIDFNAFINAQYLRYIIFEDGSKLTKLGDNVLPQSTYWSRIIVMPDGVSDASTTVKANNNNTVYITRNAEFKKSFDAIYDALPTKPKNVDCYVTNRSNLLGYGIINNKEDELRTAKSGSGSTQAGMWLAIGSKSTEDAETYDEIELHIVGSGVWKADYGWGYKYLVNSAAYVYPTPWNVDGINCQNINKMVIHNGVTSVATKLGGLSDNLTAKLEEVVLPCGLETIGQLSFGNQYSLKSFSHFSEDGKTIIPGLPTSTLKKIENSAFQNCTVLEPTDGEAFVIPASVESIGDSAFVNDFRDNNKVKSVIFAKGSKLKSVGKAVFQNCFNLTEVEIPASVTTMNANALNDCSADVYFEGSVSSTSDFSTMFNKTNNKTNKVYYYDDAMTSKLVNLAEGVTVTKLPLAVKAATSVSVDDTKITASVKYRAPQNMTASQSYVLILAQYDKDGALVGVDLSKAGSIEADTTQYEVPIENTVEKASDYASCKAFLWDGLDTLKSLATAE